MINKNINELKVYSKCYVTCNLNSEKYLSSNSTSSASVQDAVLDQLFTNLNCIKDEMRRILRTKSLTEQLCKELDKLESINEIKDLEFFKNQK